MTPLAVVAIGGNALVTETHQSIPDQARAVEDACKSIAALAASGWRIVVTHGNGPQVGFILRRSEIAAGEIPLVPMDYATADTQGAIGYMFQRALNNEFRKLGLKRESVTLVTQVLVDSADRAFSFPDKPIGPFYEEARSRQLAQELGWKLMEDSGRGWRRVVPSPSPLEILELRTIRSLVDSGRVVVACGGGGIPVVRDASGNLQGVEAVIDKDRSSALLARELEADAFLLCTGVEAVFTGFGTPAQRKLEKVAVREAEDLLSRGEFGKGSMAPKVEAALAFLADNPKKEAAAVIGKLERLPELTSGVSGTRFVR